MQTIEVDIINGSGESVRMRTLSAGSLGKFHTGPIGRPVGGAAEAAVLDESFDQMDGMVIFDDRVRRNSTGDRARECVWPSAEHGPAGG